MTDWINVKNKMPDRKDYGFFWSGERRLAIFVCGVIHGYRDVVLGSYSYASKQWTDLYGEKIDAVTHWMPFPKMPESEEAVNDI